MPADGFVPGNRLFACFPHVTQEHLAPDLEIVPIRVGEILHRAGRPVEHVYLPLTGMGSIVVRLRGDVNVEAAIIGNEGLLGVSSIFDDAPATEQTMVQMPGKAIRLRGRALRAEFDRDNGLRALLLRYVQLLIGQIARGSACNRAHHIGARCARWLLSTHDRVDGDEFPLTQEFLAMMLGVRRAGVSVAQHKLLRDRLIDYNRGIITILNRKGLEDIACECYAVLQRRFEQFYQQFEGSDGPQRNGPASRYRLAEPHPLPAL